MTAKEEMPSTPTDFWKADDIQCWDIGEWAVNIGLHMLPIVVRRILVQNRVLSAKIKLSFLYILFRFIFFLNHPKYPARSACNLHKAVWQTITEYRLFLRLGMNCNMFMPFHLLKKPVRARRAINRFPFTSLSLLPDLCVT
jgi:hypothetical protein